MSLRKHRVMRDQVCNIDIVLPIIIMNTKFGAYLPLAPGFVDIDLIDNLGQDGQGD